MYQSKIKRTFQLISLTACYAAVTACHSSSNTLPINSNVIPITITFNSAGCPTSANANLSNNTKSGDKLLFKSSPVNQQYSLTFGPFVGKPYRSNAKGEILTIPLNSKSFASNLQKATFKYSIYAKGCPMVDPMIIINR